MKRTFGSMGSLFALAFGFCAMAQETISVRGDLWAPFNGDPSSDKPGYAIEIMKAVFEPNGIKIDYQTIPWTSAMKGLQEGKFEAAVGASKEDCPDAIFPELEIADIRHGFFALPSSKWRFKGIDSLSQIKLGVIEGYTYGEDVDRYIASAKVSGKVEAIVGDGVLEKNIKKLHVGRIDAVIEAPQVFSWTVKTMGLPENTFVNVGSLEKSQKNYIAFSPAKESSKKYAKMFDDGIRELRRNGKLKTILAKYGLKDWRD